MKNQRSKLKDQNKGAVAAGDTIKQLPHLVFGEKKTMTVALPAFLQLVVSPLLLSQAVHTSQKRRRIRRAHTKDRSEVRGGGRKPWKQKGTGRSRHGSIRSPIWVGGGVAFGPRSRKSRVLPLPTRMARRAFAGALASHTAAGTLSLVSFKAELPRKTREFVQQLPARAGRVLILIDLSHRDIILAGRNVAGITILPAPLASVTDVLAASQLWIDEAALPVLERRCGNAKKAVSRSARQPVS